MSIFLNGLQVRADELKHDLKVEFRDLNQKGQCRFFMENKNVFLYDALTSQYQEVNSLPLQFKEVYSSYTLNETIGKLAPIGSADSCKYINSVIELLNIPNFEPDEEVIKKLSTSMYYPILFWVAEYDNTSFEILEDMFFRECRQFLYNNYSDLLAAIILNPNFKLDYDFDNKIEKRFRPDEYYRIIEKVKTLKCTQNT